MKYQCVADSRQEFPDAMMCRLLQIKPSGFYAWVRRTPSRRSQENDRLRKKIAEIHAKSDGTYGSPKVHDELVHLGFEAGKHRAARLLREMSLKGRPRKRYRVTTQSDHGFRTAPYSLDRQFTADSPSQRWASDITYIRTGEGWLYRAVVIGLYSIAIVDWYMSHRITRDLVLQALLMALLNRTPGEGLMHHSDRSSQYASGDFQALLDEHGIECSMSGAGNCYDNAAVEASAVY